MSVQPNTEIVSNACPALPSEGSKVVALNGKERTVELIKIDDGSIEINKKILNNESLKNLANKQIKENLIHLALAVAACFTLVAVLLFALTPLTIATILPFAIVWLPLFIGVSCAAIPTIIHDLAPQCSKVYDFNNRIRELQTCKEILRNEEFRVFAKTFGEEFPTDKLLEIHQLFLMEKQDQEIRKSEMNSTFKKEIS